MPKPGRGFWGWLGLAAGLVLVDQLSKLAVLARFQLGESLEITSFFNLVLVYNPGAAFSFLAAAGGWQKWFFVALALGISAWIIHMLLAHPEQKRQNLALTLILGGALGNVIDRVAYGAVVDFLDFHLAGWHWPAFNVADSGITVGAVLLVLDQLLQSRTRAS
ncbi:signal peptidase II [Azovibrio restrictus]|uniref:signal peptidase II n=1 Tax=Azovibrio restrictus TaxID=146938 RepID=UPI0003FBED30|nr:signal peptidase II [Azovibrio restrictus]MCE1171431.1 signal peptidase II [Azovibrio sp.]